MKKVFKTLLIALGIIIVLHLLLFGVVIYSAFDPISKTDTNWNNYDMYRTELHYAEEFLPSQNEFSNTKAVHFSYQKNFMLMFISKTVAVTVQYTPEEYLDAKKASLSVMISWMLRCFTIVITIMNWTTPLPTRATISAWFPTMAADTLAWSVQTMILAVSLTCITAILIWTILPKQTKILIRKCAH